MTTTFARIKKLHTKHPDWCSVEIARALNLTGGYVRKLCQRNGLKLPDGRGWNRIVGVPVIELKPYAKHGETPEQTLARILRRAA